MKTEQSDYTEMNTENSVLQQEAKPAPALLHRTCKTILLQSFIEVFCNNDLSFLVISGEPAQSELIDAMQELIFDWATLINSEDSNYVNELKKSLGMLEAEINFINEAIPLLKIQVKYRCIDPELIVGVNSLGYYLPGKPKEHELELVYSLSKRKVFDYNELAEEYERLTKTKEGKKQTEEDFMKTVAAISKYCGFRINTKETTALEFAAMFNNYLAEAERIKKVES